ncbi:hypothetical protein [Clavibacter sp. MX14-G9D]|uniref:Uncharacterized protein n=1 Tax=Clavibacter michiganensis TaxID=28447 RepID=A0A251XVV6_9MICO|nr:hypothetical protein [Clavibacter sp. MX14-G9D]OUE09646.1 hypothetical protein CMsap09_11925 [Clavibacter michiganensis]
MTSTTARRRALRDAVILTAFFLVSQLVVVPMVGGGAATEHLGPALVVGVLVFAAAYLIRRATDGRRRDRG